MKKSGVFSIIILLLFGLINSSSAQNQLTGFVNYNDNDTLPIPQVTLGLYDFQEILVVSTMSGSNGQYLFDDIPEGEYVLRSSTLLEPDLVDMKDAYIVLMYLLDWYELDDIQYEAADIDNSGTVTWHDYFYIVINYLLNGEPFPAGVWQFEEVYVDFSSSRAAPDTTDQWGITEGDVEGIWEPSGRDLDLLDYSHYPVQIVSNEFQFDVNTNYNDQIAGFTINLAYPTDQLKITAVSGPDDKLNYIVDEEKGIVKVIWLDENKTGRMNGDKLITLTAETQSADFKNAAIELLQESMLIDANGHEIKDIEIQLPMLEKNEDMEISVSTYPNPVVDQLHIDINFGKAESASISIYNTNGKLVTQTEFVSSENSTQIISIDTQEFISGNYFYVVELSGNAKYRTSGQFVKSH